MKLTTDYLKTLTPAEQKEAIVLEYYKCSQDIKYTIETYFTVLAGKSRIPFKLFPHQVETVDAYMAYTNNISMKTRQMGFTTVTAVFIAFMLIFNNNYKAVIISKDMNSAKEFLKEIKAMLDDARENYPWLVPNYMPKYNNKQNFILMNGSLVKAEGGDQAGRGTPGATLCVVDEVAYVDKKFPGKMSDIWAAISPTLASTKGKAIMISTPAGSSGWYYETYIDALNKGFNIIDAHWIKHPMYSQGAYQWIQDKSRKEGGFLKFLTETWPDTLFDRKAGNYINVPKDTYPFICDGKIRSPWYDIESAKLGPRLTKCELDCSFVGTGGEVFDSDILRDLKMGAEACTFKNPYSHLKGVFTNYREYHKYVEGHKYVLAADVATGDGSDYSTFVVLDLTDFKIAATYKQQVYPTAFATILKAIGHQYGTCPVVVENQGGGETTLQTMRAAVNGMYSNIYYSTLNKKDPSTGIRKRKIGLWASEDVRLQGGDQLEEKIRTKELFIPCTVMVEEFYNWIWDKDGKRRHAPTKNDDLIMALQHALWYAFYVYNRGERNRGNFKQIFEVQRNSETVRISEQSHGKGTIIKTKTHLTGDSRRVTGGNLDKMVDSRVLSPTELEQKYKTKKRYFL